MIEMERGTMEGVRFIETRLVIHPDMAEAVKAEFGLSDEQMRERFVVTRRITPVWQEGPLKAVDSKALHRQELQKISRRGKGRAK